MRTMVPSSSSTPLRVPAPIVQLSLAVPSSLPSKTLGVRGCRTVPRPQGCGYGGRSGSSGSQNPGRTAECPKLLRSHAMIFFRRAGAGHHQEAPARNGLPRRQGQFGPHQGQGSCRAVVSSFHHIQMVIDPLNASLMRRFEPLLQKCQADLAAGKRKPRPFAKEQQIHEGLFFVLKGILLYVAKVGEKITHAYGAFSRTAPSPICCCVSMCSTGRPASRTSRMVHRAARHNRARRRQA